jgi:hypothetical protein
MIIELGKASLVTAASEAPPVQDPSGEPEDFIQLSVD